MIIGSLSMHSTRWLNVAFPPSQNSSHGKLDGGAHIEGSRDGQNGATDALRALLLLVLFALTFAAAMCSTILRGEWARSHITSLVACVGGGVFLATCLLDLLPDCLESFEKTGFDVEFPVAEAAVVGGLLMVLSMEQLVLAGQERGWIGHSRHIRLHDEDGSGDAHSHFDRSLEDEEGEGESMLGAALLVLALSLHALFEGLSLAVISDASKLLQVFGALILHKTIIGFSLGVRLVETGMRTPWVALCAFCFSIQILIGGLGGLAIMTLISGGKKTTAAFVSSMLQGVACGTFLYITTFEVIPHELNKKGRRLTKLLCLFGGVAIVGTFMILFPDAA